jgi:hypothetical protein
MKTDNIYFHCRNNEADSELVRAVEALPDEFIILPEDAEMGCVKKDSRIIIYPHNPKKMLFSYEHINTKDYREHRLSSAAFKLDNFSYKVLRLNPIGFYDYCESKGNSLFREYSNKIIMERIENERNAKGEIK